MSTTKIAISIDEGLLEKLDRLVKKHLFPNRSKAIQSAVEEKLTKMSKSRLAIECAKLNPNFEQNLAEEGMAEEIKEWPEY